MGIYIKDMDKPKDCNNCFLFKQKYNEYTDAFEYSCEFNAVIENCPLIEVKAPHGRLIDVTKIPYLECADPEVTELVGDAPTVIEAEVGNDRD